MKMGRQGGRERRQIKRTEGESGGRQTNGERTNEREHKGGRPGKLKKRKKKKEKQNGEPTARGMRAEE